MNSIRPIWQLKKNEEKKDIKAQCGNSRIFLIPRFYVKSILAHSELLSKVVFGGSTQSATLISRKI